MLIAGAAILGLGSRSNARSDALRVSRPDSAQAIGKAGRVAVVATKSTSTRVARPHVIRALRNVQPRRAEKLGAQAEENEALALRPASSRDGAIQGNPGRGMPAPMQNFEGLSNVDGSFRPDTAGDVGPNHYMQWINFSFADLQQAGHDRVRAGRGEHALPRLRPFAGRGTVATRSSCTTSSPVAGSPASLRTRASSTALTTSAWPSRGRATRRPDGARTSS